MAYADVLTLQPGQRCRDTGADLWAHGYTVGG